MIKVMQVLCRAGESPITLAMPALVECAGVFVNTGQRGVSHYLTGRREIITCVAASFFTGAT
ncbi:hypothetical protein Q4561_11080 [Alteromonas sp. 1_MG-2023]|uniref:hypothetical protein n=1 Tax=Alteromonas sp. 1_MG-2023 TaxID=3062669 RepID=UPI0026E28394|nr:hypothetical protein [Alteromonas sp. 1_MG-2023]MDO6567600.1 hypothetical protein [Alteromonas sp. 1_MG-2023]